MPKPTFLQSVLRKPTRSYADPYFASPWADHAEVEEEEYEYERPASRFSSRVDNGVHLGFEREERRQQQQQRRGRDGPEDAGPSSRPRVARSTSSAISDNTLPSMGTRFPKPARKVQSSVVLRESVIVRVPADGAEHTQRRRKKKAGGSVRSEAGSSMASPPESPGITRGGTVVARRKTRPPPSVEEGDDDASTVVSSTYSQSVTKVPSLQSRKSPTTGESSSSSASSPVPPLSPVIEQRIAPSPQPRQSAAQKVVSTRMAPPLTPPSSDSTHSLVQAIAKQAPRPSSTVPPPRPPTVVATRPRSVHTVGEESDDGGDAFFTPPGSPASASTERSPQQAVPSGGLRSPLSSVPVIAVSPEPKSLDIPQFSFQPPTPAPLPDPTDSPFHSDPPTASTSASSLHPERQPSPRLPSQAAVSASRSDGPTSPPFDDETHSLHGEAGSDDEDDSERREGSSSGQHSRQSSYTKSVPAVPSKAKSRASSATRSNGASSVDGNRRPLSRQSTRTATSSKTFDDFKVLDRRQSMGARSEASFGGRSAREGSVRSGISGYGKGGWAAAHASNKSRPTSPPMMYMPTSGADGWADFQPPPPKRDSKFTPLPPASEPITFDKLVYGRPSLGAPVDPRRGVPSGSTPSSYSQDSDEDPDLPRPSRSYARNDYASEGSRSVASSVRDMDDATPVPRQQGFPNDARRTSSPGWNRPPQMPSKESSYSSTRSDERSQRGGWDRGWDEHETSRPQSRQYQRRDFMDGYPERGHPGGSQRSIASHHQEQTWERYERSRQQSRQDGTGYSDERRESPPRSVTPGPSGRGWEAYPGGRPPSRQEHHGAGLSRVPHAERRPDFNAYVDDPQRQWEEPSRPESRMSIRGPHAREEWDRTDGETPPAGLYGPQDGPYGRAPDRRNSQYAQSAYGSNYDPSPSISFPVARVRPFSPPPQVLNGYSRPTSPAVASSPFPSRPTSPVAESTRPMSPRNLDAPSFLDPDTLTLLPEMTPEDSDRTYLPPAPSEVGTKSRSASRAGERTTKRASSVLGSFAKPRSEAEEDEDDEVPELPLRRSKSVIGGWRREKEGGSKWEGSSYGDGVLLESHGRSGETSGGYTNLILPTGAYRPTNPAKFSNQIDSRILGLPHATMAALTFSLMTYRDTPAHLRHDLPPPVDFSSHLKPPGKCSASQVLVQVYAVAIDGIDVKGLDDKGKGDVGKWVPGRSLVGRCLQVGTEEKDVVRGDIVVGLIDVRKSGALAEYILVDRRRLARAPYPTALTLEQLSLLPLQGISALRTSRLHLQRHSRALIVDADAGIPALVCQLMARAGVNVTAVIPGGDDHHLVQTMAMQNGARGVLTGSPAAVMLGLDEGGWDFVLDTQGGQRVYDAAKRILRDGGKLVTLVQPEASMPSKPQLSSRPSGLKTLRAAFGSKRKDSKTISYEYLPPAGSGEPAVDSSGVDCRDVLEEPGMTALKPVVKQVWPFEKGMEAFRSAKEHGKVIRLIN